ncbi:hypothetical protein MBLNU230_g7988t1 [Neophaeotheca triangularis]
MDHVASSSSSPSASEKQHNAAHQRQSLAWRGSDEEEDSSNNKLDTAAGHNKNGINTDIDINNNNNNDNNNRVPPHASTTAFNTSASAHNGGIPIINTKLEHDPLAYRVPSNYHPSPANLGLHLETDLDGKRGEAPAIHETPAKAVNIMSSSADSSAVIGSSLGRHLSTNSMPSPGTSLPSPYLAAMTDLTPLPSPLTGSSALSAFSKTKGECATPSKTSSRPASPTSPPKKAKGYGSLVPAATEASRTNATPSQGSPKLAGVGHGRNRSVSDFIPVPLSNTRQRHVTFGPGDNVKVETPEYHMQRESYLAAQRGLVAQSPAKDAAKKLPSPPPSSSSVVSSTDDDDSAVVEGVPNSEYIEVRCGLEKRKRKYRKIRELGQGTFSKVVLATTERAPLKVTPEAEQSLNPAKLVAIKVVEHGPAGGADEERVETSLQREVEILKSVSHPSLVHLKECELLDTRGCLVLTYRPGGDLFELASEHLELLTRPLVQRVFAELVHAVSYLHAKWIVHRDLKLENVLVNIPPSQLANITDPTTHPAPLITVTDLGLSKRVPPSSPLLTTRCGSEDYAAPELLLGQPYDGRLTDAWALGVLLYALMEGRLPFDAPPGKPDRSRKTHRIARCDWIWTKFGDEWGDWDGENGSEWEGARECVEALLRKAGRGRKTLAEVGEMGWVRGGVKIEGGLTMRDGDGDEAME